MYEAFYGLDLDPFRLSPDHRFCFEHSSYTKAKAYLDYGLRRAEGLIAVTGSPGTGKSTLVDDLLAGLSASGVVTARLVSTQLKATDLLRMLAFEFKIRAEGVDKASLLRSLEAFMVIQAGARRRVLVIIDEAQDLSMDALEELRLLTNMQLKSIPLVQVFLLGQDQLHAKIMSPSMEQLRQRLVAVSRLEPMTVEETHAYIAHRLRHAGWNGDPEITGEAVALVYKHSRGVPRLVNQTCSRLLLYGSSEQKHKLDDADARAVIRELEDEMAPSHGKDSDQVAHGQQSALSELTLEPELLTLMPIKRIPAVSISRHAGGTGKNAKSEMALATRTDAAVKDRGDNRKLSAIGSDTRADVGISGTQSVVAKRQEQSRRGTNLTLIILLIGLAGAGALAVVSLESIPFGARFTDWSRDVAVDARDMFTRHSLVPASEGAETGTPTEDAAD